MRGKPVLAAAGGVAGGVVGVVGIVGVGLDDVVQAASAAEPARRKPRRL
jgi:hypothetical protein